MLFDWGFLLITLAFTQSFSGKQAVMVAQSKARRAEQLLTASVLMLFSNLLTLRGTFRYLILAHHFNLVVDLIEDGMPLGLHNLHTGRGLQHERHHPSRGHLRKHSALNLPNW